MNIRTTCFAALAASLLTALPASAQTSIISVADVMPSPIITDQSVDWSFNNPSGFQQALLTFDIVGYGSLDGDNDYIDVFRLALNSSELLTGTFNMSGGGSSYLISSPVGATFQTTQGVCTPSNYCGGITHLSLMVNLTDGNNTFNFSYNSPSTFAGTDRHGFQGMDDEAWRIGALSVTAVPEPETYAMLLGGLGLVGAIARRRRQA